MKKRISIIIVLVLLVTLSLQSCDYFSFSGSNRNIPTSYTGGYEGIHNGMGLEFYWVETYEEMQEAVELLKSHGSTFQKSMLFTYEGELFDTKYCFTMKTGKSDRIEWGENPFDRKALDVRVHSVAFFEEYTIDYITKIMVSQLNAYEFSLNYTLEEAEDIDYTKLPREWKIDGSKTNIEYNSNKDEITYDQIYTKTCTITVDEDRIIKIGEGLSLSSETMSDKCLDALLGSIEYFGFE